MATNLKIMPQTAARQLRRHRRPQEPFNVRSRPFEITPFMFHPVLPNESLDNLLFQVDAYSDPIVNRNLGWHANYQFFYIPLMALVNPDLALSGEVVDSEIAAMMLDNSTTGDIVAGAGHVEAANSVPLHVFKGSAPWMRWCMEVVINRFYRDEDDRAAYAAASSMEYPLAYINQRSWLHSLKEESVGTDDPELPGVDEIEDLDILSGYSTHQTQWEIMRDSGMEDITYADYLKAQGVRGSVAQKRAVDGGETVSEPELLRFVRKWTKPISTFDLTDGSAATALRWSCAELADKTRYFREPVFILGIACTTP